ncbi:MAG: hypothetical protein HY308_02925 [Gammaproteobacteria bacterium]|nr:hypothetical protein [Gammaproteobacteria bacterium]
MINELRANGLLPLAIVLLLALLAGVVAGWLIMRARKPLRLPAFDGAAATHSAWHPANWWRALRDAFDELMVTLRYLRTRREWRYRAPWVLLIGETGSGRSSLAISIGGRRQQMTAQEQALTVSGGVWHFFDRGSLIDVDGATMPAVKQDADNHQWHDVLRQLNDYRPERAIDGVVLALSAHTLLRGSGADLQQLAERCRSQLWELQQRFEFALPVYVIVTQCDTIDGFSVFWQAQPEKRRAEMVGWSNPYGLDNTFVVDWTDEALDRVTDTLKLLQLQAAAGDRVIDQVDEFFLFPQRFNELRTSLRAVLAPMFRASAYQADTVFRGLYFVGSIDAAGVVVPSPREDIGFVDHLFEEKVFAELNLAQPTRHGLWSRHQLIRRVQVATVSVLAFLFLTLLGTAIGLHRQVGATVDSLSLIRNPPRLTPDEGACIGKDVVYELLTNVAKLDVSFIYVNIPASWVDRRTTYRGSAFVSQQAIEKVVFPSLACHLEQRAQALLDDEDGAADKTLAADRLQRYVDRVVAFERNLARFHQIVVYNEDDPADQMMQAFDDLVLYLYGESLPPISRRTDDQHRRSLANAEYTRELALPVNMRGQIAKRIVGMADDTRQQLVAEVQSGGALLDALKREQTPMLGNLRRFDQWLDRVRSVWLASNEHVNPCHKIADTLTPAVAELQRMGYPAGLAELPPSFGLETCYEPSMRQLAQLQVAPHGVLFRHGKDRWELTPAIVVEAEGLRAAAGASFMQLDPASPFTCQLPLRGWRTADLAEAATHIREYQQLVRGDDATNAARPLYVRVLARQLQAVLDDTLNRAQLRAGYADGRGTPTVDALSQADQAMAQQSNDFTRSIDSLLWVLRMYQQLGFDASQARINQCARNYTTQSLQTIYGLAESSRLYDPGFGVASGGDDTVEPFVALTGTAQIKDYLDRQLQRGQVLGSYASPFVTFLKNTDAVGDAELGANNGRVYWENTIQELNRFIQFKEPNAQIAKLNDFFLKQLDGIDTANCEQVLNAYRPEVYGDDLFSRRRRQIEQQAQWNCFDRSRAVAYAQYQNLVRRFSSELSGRFPFGSLQDNEASVTAVRSFFLDYAKQRDTLRAKLGGLKGDGWREIGLFLDQLDEAAAFFAGNVAAADAVQPLRVQVAFRALPKQSVGAENIVNWRLNAGGPTATYPNGKTELDWRYGQPVSVDLTWADLAHVEPLPDPQQQNLHVNNNAATFDADGPWALLKLLRRHAPSQGPRLDPNDPSVALLEFRVPTQDKAHTDAAAPVDSRIYLGLRLQGVDPKTQTAVALKLPKVFPAYAPMVW